jgi:hypothetical protein
MLSFLQELNFERMLILGQEVNLERMLIFGQELNFVRMLIFGQDLNLCADVRIRPKPKATLIGLPDHSEAH